MGKWLSCTDDFAGYRMDMLAAAHILEDVLVRFAAGSRVFSRTCYTAKSPIWLEFYVFYYYRAENVISLIQPQMPHESH